MKQLEAEPELAALLGRHRDAIQDSWAKLLRNTIGGHYRDRSDSELSSWTADGIAAIIESIDRGSVQSLAAHATSMSLERRQLDFAIDEVIAGLLALEDLAVPIVMREFCSDASRATRMLASLSASIRILVARFGKLYSASMRHTVERERQRMALLLETTEAAGASLDLETVLDRVARCLASALDASWCGVFLADEEAALFRPQAAVGEVAEKQLRNALSRPLEAETDSLVTRARKHRRIVYYRGSDSFPLLCDLSIPGAGVASAVAIPISMRDRVLALALAIHVQDELAFGPEAAELAQGIAHAVAPAVDHARLYSELHRNLAESRMLQRITAAVLDRIGLHDVLAVACGQSRDLVEAGGGAILLRTDEGGLTVASRTGAGVERAEDALEELTGLSNDRALAEPVFVNYPESNDPDNRAAVRSLLAAPLRVHGNFIGVLLLVNKRNGFGTDDIRIVNTIADQVAVAIEHARLHEQQEHLAVLEERQRLARDLHDSVTQSLYGVAVLAEASARLVAAGQASQAGDNLRELRDAALAAQREMRLLIFELHPPDLQKEGLVAVLQKRLAAVEGRAGLQIDFRFDDADRMPQAIEDHLYGIAQEALNNTIKHAGASRVSVRLSRSDAAVTLELTDDGTGFDIESARSRGGLGLDGMKERAEKVGGRLEITSRAGEGTTVTVQVPCPAD